MERQFLCDTAIVIFTITSTNDQPVAVDDVKTTQEDSPVVVDVQANDSDLDGDALTTEILDSTNSGTLILLNGDSIQFTPDTNFNGKDTLTYRICDNGTPVLCDTATVIFTINAANDKPLAIDDTKTTEEDNLVVVDVQANDSDLDGDSLTTEILDSTNSGTLVLLNGDSIQFTPDANFNGKDTFTYRICDNGMPVLCDIATVIFTIGAVNDKPLAIDDTKTTEEDNLVVVDVQANDTDLDGDALTTEILDSTNSGTLVLLNGDSIQYFPDVNFNGKDTLTYRICDNGTPVLCDTATVYFYRQCCGMIIL